MSTHRNILLLFLFVISFSCDTSNEKQIKNLIKILETNDLKMKKPQTGEWLYEHKEKGQSFKKYTSQSPLTPSNSKNVIYIQPIGNFAETQIKVIKYAADYLNIFFGLQTYILPIMDDSIIPQEAKRIGIENNTQLLTTFILDNILKQKIPENAIVIIAITEKDLYPSNTWNFVFEQASYRERVGVTSIYRFGNYVIDSANYSLCLNRLIKTTSHEIGHMFTIDHCVNAICTMNGSNSLTENDRRPNRLCSECTGKIIWNLKPNVCKRLKHLQLFFEKHRLQSDLKLIEKDLLLLEKYCSKNKPAIPL